MNGLVCLALGALLSSAHCAITPTVTPTEEALPPRALRASPNLVAIELCPLARALPALAGRLEIDVSMAPYVWLVDDSERRLEVVWPAGFYAYDGDPPVVANSQRRVVFTDDQVVEFPLISPDEHSGTSADPFLIEGELAGQCYVEVRAP